MDTTYSYKFIWQVFKGFTAFFSAMLISAILFSSLGYIDGAQAETGNVDIQLNVRSVLDLRIEKSGSTISELDLSVTPTSAGTFVKDDLDVIVNTSNPTGYTLTFADKDTDTAMHNTVSTITDTITSLTTYASEQTFSNNTWGYSIEDIAQATQVFSPIPTSTAPATIKTTTVATTEDVTPVTFATKVDSTLPAGTYQDTVVFSATTNYVPTSPLEQITNMQDMTAEICAASTVGDTATLTDTRDNNTYTIRKMEDGKCWMTQNLRLGSTSSAVTLTPADSDVTSNFTIPTSAVQTSGNTAWASSSSDETGVNTTHVYNNGNSWIQPTSSGSAATVNNSGTPPSQSQYIGNYYNWYTATAGTGTYAMSSGEAPSSICPKGWKLPTSGSTTADFNSLTQALVQINTNTSSVPDKSFTMQSAPNYFVLSGRYNSGVNARGSNGYWWSRTANSSTTSYNLYLGTPLVYPQANDYKYYGFSVRCIADDSMLASIDTMQDMTTEICTKAPIGDEKILRDTRDGNTYTIRKMEDNKCWMTQNLRLGSTSSAVTLTPTDSDVTSNFTIPTSAVQTSGTTSWGYDETRVYNNGNSWIAPTSSGSNATVNTSGTPPSQSQYIGNYYNWYTATAGTGTQNGVTSGNAPSSICPKGWKLPTDDTASGSFYALTTTALGAGNNAAGSWKLQSAPNYFVLSGYYGSGVDRQGSYGFWWSSMARSSNNAYSLFLRTSYVYPQYDDSKFNGYSVRCLAR